MTVYRKVDSDEATQDTYGIDRAEAEKIGEFRCNIEPRTGNEMDAGGQRFAEARWMIRMQPQRGVTFTRKMFGVWNGRTLDFLDVQFVGGKFREEIEFLCRDYDG